jgi:hypothetical protein
MTDRELLELAAKAAGVELIQMPPGVYRNATGAKPENNAFGLPTWNPLTDDGDALRLAVKLEIDLAFEGSPDIVWADDNWSEPAGVDRQAATRRAIVRAAAEIGRRIAQQTARADLPEDNYYKTMAEAEETGRTAAKIGRQMP